MRFPESLLGLALLKLALASPAHVAKRQNTTCASGVHMIVARASLESQGEGIIGAVANMIQAAVPGSDSEAVVYPATLLNYTTSEGNGTIAMTNLIESYVSKCPSSKIALLGYSQVRPFGSAGWSCYLSSL